MVGLGLVSLSVGIALMGYFIGKGLQHLGHPQINNKSIRFLTSDELGFQLNLSKNELEELLRNYPNAPKIELNGTTYFPYKVFIEWLSTSEFYKQ